VPTLGEGCRSNRTECDYADGYLDPPGANAFCYSEPGNEAPPTSAWQVTPWLRVAGMSWTSSVSPGTDLSNPRAPATNFFQSIAVTSDFIYALTMTPNPQGGRIYKTKANGQPAWVSVADLQGFAIGGSVVVTGTGTVVAGLARPRVDDVRRATR
jgi:hypothetical protein